MSRKLTFEKLITDFDNYLKDVIKRLKENDVNESHTLDIGYIMRLYASKVSTFKCSKLYLSHIKS